MSLVLFYFPVSPKCPRLSPPGKCLHGAGRYEGTALLSVSVDKWLAVRLRVGLVWQSGWQARGHTRGNDTDASSAIPVF